MKSIAKALNLGSTIIISLLLPLGIGCWIDYKLNTTPIFLLLGVLFGLVLAFYSLYQLTKNL